MEFYGVPPIGKKVAAATRPMDGAQFHFPRGGNAVGELKRDGLLASGKLPGTFGGAHNGLDERYAEAAFFKF
jgi:hypothetical protein